MRDDRQTTVDPREVGEKTELTKIMEEKTIHVLQSVGERYGSYQDGMPNPVEDEQFVGYEQNAFEPFTQNINEQLPFHNRNHSEKIVIRVEEMCEEINNSDDPSVHISEEMKAILKYAAAMHDIGQETKIVPYGHGDDENIRNYKSGTNEDISIEQALVEIEAHLQEHIADEETKELYRNIIKHAIEGTKPKNFDLSTGTIYQQLDTEAPWQAHLIAYADIGGSSMAPETYMLEGDSFLLEQNPYILQAFTTYRDGKKVNDETKEKVEKKIKGWDKVQIGWAKGRKQMFFEGSKTEDGDNIPADISHVPDAVQKQLKKRFDKYDTSIDLATQRQELRKDMAFEQLAENFGFAHAA